jgi:myo-inositol-1(or 4)-monophosphatase
MSTNELEALLDLATRCARAAGAEARRWFERPHGELDVRRKTSARDLVSDADVACERIVLELLGRERPGDAIAGEETAAVEGTSGLRWGIDPIDGTSNFVSGIPHWCVSIGVEDASGASVVGVVYDPVADELYAAAAGRGVSLNGAPLVERRDGSLDEAILAFGISADWWRDRGTPARTLDVLLPAVAHGREMGSMALDMGWLAAGRFDAYYYESGLHPHDIAQRVVLTEAGLAVRTLPETAGAPAALLAAPPQLADRLLGLLAPIREPLRA